MPVGADGLLGPNAPATAFDVDAVLQRMLAVQGQAPWASGPRTVGRAAFIYDLMLSAGQLPYILEDDRTISSVHDVPDSTPGVYYIEQAEEQGWVLGILAYPGSYQWQGPTSLVIGDALLPDQPITLAAALQLADIATESAMYPSAYGSDHGVQYAELLAHGLASQRLPFADSAKMSPDERGFVAEALTLGILPPSSAALRIDAAITPQENATLLARLQAVILSRMEHPQTPGAPAYIGTTTVEPVSTQCTACSIFSAVAFDRQGYATSSTISAAGSQGITVKTVAIATVKQGNVVIVPALPASGIEVTTTDSELATVTLRSGAAAAKIQVPVVQLPVEIVVHPATPDVEPGSDVGLTASLKDATGKVFPVSVDWRLVAPSYTVGNPPQFQWGTLQAWGPSASTTFLASGTPGQGQIAAVLPSIAGDAAPATGSATVNVISDVKTLKASMVDVTSGSTSVALVGDTLKVQVEGLDASGKPATTPDVISLWANGSGALQNGATSWTVRATNAGTMQLSVADLSNGAVKGVDLQMPVVLELQPGPETGVRLLNAEGKPVIPTAVGSGMAVWVRPVDADGMPTSVTGSSAQTVDLLGTGVSFLDQQGGNAIRTVTLEPGSTGVEVWLQSAAGSSLPAASAGVDPIRIESPLAGSTVALGGNLSIDFTVVDAYGNPLAGVPVTFAMSPPQGSDTDGNQDPVFTLAYTASETGNLGGVSALIQGASTTPDTDFTSQLAASVPNLAEAQPITLTW